MDIEIPLPNFVARVWEVCVESEKKKKKFWQTNCGNAIAEIGKKNCNNCSNDIAKNEEKKVVRNLQRVKKSVTFTIFSQ